MDGLVEGEMVGVRNGRIGGEKCWEWKIDGLVEEEMVGVENGRIGGKRNDGGGKWTDWWWEKWRGWTIDRLVEGEMVRVENGRIGGGRNGGGQKKSRFSGPTHSNASCNRCCPHQNQYILHHINNRYTNSYNVVFFENTEE
jgi:hypothetical protein